MKKTMQLDLTNQLAHIEIQKRGEKEVIVKTWGKGFGWTEEDAASVIKMHKQYVNNLQELGIRTSLNLEEKVLHDENECLIQSTEEYFSQGDMLANLMMSTNKSEFLELAERQVTQLAEVLFSIPPLARDSYSLDWFWMQVPMDLKPQNAVISNKTVVVVDTFRPQLWVDGKVELQPMPSTYPFRRKIPHDEIKTGDLRFHAGRLFGYYVAIATRWYINQTSTSDIEELDAFRHEMTSKIIPLVSDLIIKNGLFSEDVAEVLISDIKEIANESLSVGSYEGPRYVQDLYEQEEREKIGSGLPR